MSDKQSNQPDERQAVEEDANEDLELNDDSAGQVHGGTGKHIDAAPDAPWK